MAVLEGVPQMERGRTEERHANWGLVLEVGQELKKNDPADYADWVRSMRAGMEGEIAPMDGQTISDWNSVYKDWTREDFRMLLIAIGEVEAE